MARPVRALAERVLRELESVRVRPSDSVHCLIVKIWSFKPM